MSRTRARAERICNSKGLKIKGQFLSGTEVVATRSTGVTFLPGESRRKAGLFFPVDPRLYELELYPVGLRRPVSQY